MREFGDWAAAGPAVFLLVRRWQMSRHCSRLAGVLAVMLGVACAHLPTKGSGLPLRVMTYNIAAGYSDLDRTSEAIRASAADLVALQEVDVHWGQRSGFIDQAAAVAARLKMQFRFARIYQLPGANASAPAREYGVALLSRFPIVEWSNHIITRLSTQQETPAPAPLPGFLEARIDVGGTAVRVFSSMEV